MSVEPRSPAVCNSSNKTGGKGEMTKAPISLQDLRRSLYVKAKPEPTWRFWGLYVHVCKMETLHEAYRAAKKNDGAPGIDGVTFDAIEEGGVESFLRQIKDELVSNTYRPMGLRKKEILSRNQVWRPQYTPRLKKRKALFVKLREIFRRFMSQPVERVIELINPILRGWVNYFAVWHSSRCFAFVKD